LLKQLNFRHLFRNETPWIYHNAWNLSRRRMDLFANKVTEPNNEMYGVINEASLCACSALPFVEQTVQIDGQTYCEGALVDVLNFDRLLDDHAYLDEIWVLRIIDVQQVRPPKNLHDSFGNMLMMFAGALGKDGTQLFRYEARERGWKGKIIEVPVSTKIDFTWSHRNLDLGLQEGYAAASIALTEFGGGGNATS
jgi:predicted acylesterase/phospholipase RssA